jgi:dolichyl-phosphate mannosyltransferase polypeptide 3
LPAKIQEDLIPYVRSIHPQEKYRSRQDPDNVFQLPFWAIISFGAYLLGKLGYNVMTFHDVPEAHKELMAEIEIARADLKKMGVEVD